MNRDKAEFMQRPNHNVGGGMGLPKAWGNGGSGKINGRVGPTLIQHCKGKGDSGLSLFPIRTGTLKIFWPPFSLFSSPGRPDARAPLFQRQKNAPSCQRQSFGTAKALRDHIQLPHSMMGK